MERKIPVVLLGVAREFDLEYESWESPGRGAILFYVYELLQSWFEKGFFGVNSQND